MIIPFKSDKYLVIDTIDINDVQAEIHLRPNLSERLFKLITNNSKWKTQCVCVNCNRAAVGYIEFCSLINKTQIVQYQKGLFTLDDNNIIMFTFDHIWPVSKGGRHKLSNAQLMCAKCNFAKNDNIDVTLVEKVVENVNDFINPHPVQLKKFKSFIKQRFPDIATQYNFIHINDNLIHSERIYNG